MGATGEALRVALQEALAPEPLGVPNDVAVPVEGALAGALALAVADPLAVAQVEGLPRAMLGDGVAELPPLLEADALPLALAEPRAVPEAAAEDGVQAEVMLAPRVGAGEAVRAAEGLSAPVRDADAAALSVNVPERVPSPPLCVAEVLSVCAAGACGLAVGSTCEALARALALRRPLAVALSDGAAVPLAHAEAEGVLQAALEADAVAAREVLASRESRAEALIVEEPDSGALAVWEASGLAVGVRSGVALGVSEDSGDGEGSPEPTLLAVAAPERAPVPVASPVRVASVEALDVAEAQLPPVSVPFTVALAQALAVGSALPLRASVALAPDAEAHAEAASAVALGQRLGEGVSAGEAERALAVPGNEGVAPAPEKEGRGEALIHAEGQPLAEGGCEERPLAVTEGLPGAVARDDGVGEGLRVPAPLLEAAAEGVRGAVKVAVEDCAPLALLLALARALKEPGADTVAEALCELDADVKPLIEAGTVKEGEGEAVTVALALGGMVGEGEREARGGVGVPAGLLLAHEEAEAPHGTDALAVPLPV